jgi:hypothetical protein
VDWAFNHYLEVAHPRFVTVDEGPRARSGRASLAAA